MENPRTTEKITENQAKEAVKRNIAAINRPVNPNQYSNNNVSNQTNELRE